MKFNDLAIEVAKREAGKKQINIAQIKEVLRIVGDILYTETNASHSKSTLQQLLKGAKRRANNAK